MEPNLIRKFNRYIKERKHISYDYKDNDTGISNDDMKSNDSWSLLFLILLTHNHKFCYCYTYLDKNESKNLIEFNSHLFKKYFDLTLEKYKDDKNFCYVIKKLAGYHRFREIQTNTRIISNDKHLYKPNLLKRRDYKFYIWLLTHKNYPNNRIKKYENYEKLREIDECRTLGENASLYQDSEKEISNPILYNFTESKFKKKMSEKKSLSESHDGMLLGDVFKQPSYTFYGNKSQFDLVLPSKKMDVIKQPIQEFNNTPYYYYEPVQPKSIKNETVSNFKIQINSAIIEKMDYEKTNYLIPVNSERNHNIFKYPSNSKKVSKLNLDQIDPPPLYPLHNPFKSIPSKMPEEYNEISNTRRRVRNDFVEQISKNYNDNNNYKQNNIDYLQNYSKDPILLNHLKLSNLEEIMDDGDDFENRNVHIYSNGKNTHCKCAICTNASKIKLKEPKKKKLKSKTFEEIQQTKYESRIKKLPKRRKSIASKIDYKDPYNIKHKRNPSGNLTVPFNQKNLYSRDELSQDTNSKKIPSFNNSSKRKEYKKNKIQSIFDNKMRGHRSYNDDPKKPKLFF